MGLELIIGVGVVCFLLFYVSFNLDKSHVFLKLLLMGFSVFLLIYIPAGNLESCEIVVNTSTISYLDASNYTETNTYSKYCVATSDQHLNFYQNFLWVLRVFMTYWFVYFSYMALDFLGYSTGIKEYLKGRMRK